MRTVAPLLAGLVLLAACGEREVTIKGRLREHPNEKAAPLARGTVTILDQVGEVHASDDTNQFGNFKVQAPAGVTIYAVVSKEGYVDASFRGISGLDSPMVVEDGLLYGVPEWLRDEWEEWFKGCPGFGIGGAHYVVGQVGLFESYDPTEGTFDTVGTASVRIEPGVLPDSEDTEVEAVEPIAGCYLDAAGISYDPEATVTGPSGWFAVGDVPEGPSTLVITFPVTQELESRTVYPLWMPVDGIVPRMPAWVELP